MRYINPMKSVNSARSKFYVDTGKITNNNLIVFYQSFYINFLGPELIERSGHFTLPLLIHQYHAVNANVFRLHYEKSVSSESIKIRIKILMNLKWIFYLFCHAERSSCGDYDSRFLITPDNLIMLNACEIIGRGQRKQVTQVWIGISYQNCRKNPIISRWIRL